jgi:hypothetical protein
MKKLGFSLFILVALFSTGSGQPAAALRQQANPDGRAVSNELSDRITRLEVQLESLKPLPQQIFDLKAQLVALQGKLDNLDTKLNIVMGILVAIALPLLGEVVRRISERFAPPPPSAPSGDSKTMEIFEKLIREKLALPPTTTPAATTAGTRAASA